MRLSEGEPTVVRNAQTSPDGVVSFKQAKPSQEATGTFTDVSQGVQSARTSAHTVDTSPEHLHALPMAHTVTLSACLVRGLPSACPCAWPTHVGGAQAVGHLTAQMALQETL